MVPTAERRTTTVKADVDDQIPIDVSLAAADEILAYKPIDAARGLRTPLLVIGVEGDADDADRPRGRALRGGGRTAQARHAAAHDALRRVRQVTGTSVTPLIVDWFDRHVRGGGVVVTSSDGGADVIELMEEA